MMTAGMPLNEWNKGDMIGGRYRIIRLIGQGGMGLVYAVEDMKLDGMIRAMKIGAALPGGGDVRTAEAAALMKLSHPNLPHLLDYFAPGESGGTEALVMDYCEGETIAELVAGSGSGLAYAGLLHIGLQLCSALSYLHEQPSPIIHRDLKPSNVMVDRHGHVKLIDFGISRQYKEGQPNDTVRLGTVGFAAPEQLNGGPSDAGTDVYGLGALLYYMASGGGIFDGLDGGTPEALLTRLPIPQPFRIVLERMLQPRREYRYASMAEVREALLACAGQTHEKDGSWARPFAAGTKRPELISVLSLTAGAGATLVAITLAFMLNAKGHSVTAAEYDGLQPEWSELLPGRLVGAGTGAAARERRARKDAAYEGGYANDIRWLTAEQNLNGTEHDERLFRLKLTEFDNSVKIIDFSGCWEKPEAMYWLRQSRHVLVVADPCVFKWQVPKLRKLTSLASELAEQEGRLHWIANKDMPFRGRNEWLSLFPEKPLASIPLLPPGEVLETLWSGKWITEHRAMNKRLARAFTPLCKTVANRP